jgi:methanol metabolism-related c-type cytochrome
LPELERIMARLPAIAVAAVAWACCLAGAHADGAGDPTPKSSQDGEYYDANSNPTYKIGKDGKVDWYTNIGYQMYGANCLQCHGPDGLGSTYAPSLVDAMKSMTTAQVLAIIAGGMSNVSASQDLVMPHFADDKNVMCYIEPIYIYLRARSDGALGRGRPEQFEPKPKDWDSNINACFG